MSPKTVPLLNDIYTQLSPLADSNSDTVRARAREARLILTARLYTTPNGNAANGEKRQEDEEEDPNDKYQRALKLLQDPLLPVRAHGLLLLRELVSPRKVPVGKKRKKKGKDAGPGMDAPMAQGQKIQTPAAPAALIPAILSIFLQAVQDEDSYIFLNAVQGLAAMVDGYGRDMLKGLVDEYARGLDGLGGSENTMTLQEVDTRVRVGEALGQVIKRCGGALGNYGELIACQKTFEHHSIFSPSREPFCQQPDFPICRPHALSIKHVHMRRDELTSFPFPSGLAQSTLLSLVSSPLYELHICRHRYGHRRSPFWPLQLTRTRLRCTRMSRISWGRWLIWCRLSPCRRAKQRQSLREKERPLEIVTWAG